MYLVEQIVASNTFTSIIRIRCTFIYRAKGWANSARRGKHLFLFINVLAGRSEGQGLIKPVLQNNWTYSNVVFWKMIGIILKRIIYPNKGFKQNDWDLCLIQSCNSAT